MHNRSRSSRDDCEASRLTVLSRHGWTLIEVMIALTIIGILLAIAVPSLRKARMNSQINQAVSDVNMLASAVKSLAWDTGTWPGAVSLTDTSGKEIWDLTTAHAGLLATDGDFNDWQGPYIHKVPLDPWGSPYFFDMDYRVDGVNRIVVGSFGPNKRGRNVYDDDNIYVLMDDY